MTCGFVFFLEAKASEFAIEATSFFRKPPPKITFLKREKNSPGQIRWNWGLKTCPSRQNQKLKKVTCPQNFDLMHGFWENRYANTLKNQTVSFSCFEAMHCTIMQPNLQSTTKSSNYQPVFLEQSNHILPKLIMDITIDIEKFRAYGQSPQCKNEHLNY